MVSQINNMVLIGDEIFLNFHHLLCSEILYENPANCPHLFPIHKQKLSFVESTRLIPQYILGKSPKYLLVSLGLEEIISSKPLPLIYNEIDIFFQTININIQPQKFIIGFSEILFSNQPKKIQRVKKMNRYLQSKFPTEYINVNVFSKTIIQKIITGNGEKQAIHKAGPQLTHFGAFIFSRSISKKIHL